MSKLKVIIGLGKTGVSCVRFLKKQGFEVAINDNRENPPGLNDIKTEFPDVEIVLGEFSEKIIAKADELIVSPGVSLKEPIIKKYVDQGIPAIGDIELFVRYAKAPIITITGSNGKTTVTTLVGMVLQAAGYNAIVCGNIGTPVLEILDQPMPEFYVLELSSFQLETTHSLKAKIATVLNVSPDHMDRYADFDEYLQAKQVIYKNCTTAVVNFDESEIWQTLNLKNTIAFTLHKPQQNQFGLRISNDEHYLAFGAELLLPANDLKLTGPHHWQNALAVLALVQVLAIPFSTTLDVLKNFAGIPHRCQWVAEKKGATWINDSKGTNVGATVAALSSFGEVNQGKLIWIAGGDAKHANLNPLRQPVQKYVDHAILLGQDAPLIQKVIDGVAPINHVDTLQDAVVQAAKLVKPGDTVLLSPACASFDMFDNFEQRGEVFIKAVKDL